MLIDIVKQYDSEKKEYLKEIRTQVVLQLSTQQDHKKIVTFLAKVWIINIEDSEKKVYLWFPNDFIMAQAKKVFSKSLKEAVQTVYNPQFSVEFVIYPPFSNGSDLLINIPTLLNIKPTEKSTKKMEDNWQSIKDELNDYFWILFDPSFRFDNFVAWSNNQFAFSAAKAVAENPWKEYNPLFIYGNVGLGKTHLMQAIWNDIIVNNPDKVAIYLPTSKLVDEIIQALQKNEMSALMRKLDWVDALLIDDIQFLAWKDRTQEVFLNIFNDFQSKNKQIIMSGDRPPKELMNLEPRLKTRFALWLVADIKAPDYETRMAILQSKLSIKQEEIDSDLLDIIAQHITSNVRELEWALNILLTRKKLSWNQPSEDDVYECLSTLWYSTKHRMSTFEPNNQNSKSEKSFDTIVEMVANYYWVSVAELKSDSRKKEITTARQVLMLLAKRHFKWTQQKIWMYFWGKNHATVIYAIWNIEKKLKTDSDLQRDYQNFVERIEQ